MFVHKEQEKDAEIMDAPPRCPADLLDDSEGIC